MSGDGIPFAVGRTAQLKDDGRQFDASALSRAECEGALTY
jgi:hypothetical protein